MGISEGQWNLLRSRQGTGADTITANDSGIVVPAGKVLYGIDASGCRHLLVPVNEDVVEDHESEGVQVGVRSLVNEEGRETRYADLACLKPRFNAEFAHILDDVLDELDAGAVPHSVCRNAIEKWRDLLRAVRKDRLVEHEAAGLLGELLLLRDLAAISPNAVRSWSGPEGARFDFSVSDTAVEVKTSTRRYGRLVEIRGETQLDAPTGVDLHLLFIRVEPVPAGGIRVWDLYASILGLGVSRTEMQRKLEHLDMDETLLMRDQRRYRVLESRLYRVEGSFPRIVPGSFIDGKLPPGTLHLRYMVDLSGEPPVPLDQAARDLVFQKLSQGDGNAGTA